MRGKGINYDTGFLPGGHDSRPAPIPAMTSTWPAMAGLKAARRPQGGPLT